MANTNNIWLLVGRETEGNNVKRYIFMNYNGSKNLVPKKSAIKFCREHEVLNVQISGDNLTGKGIAITALPRYTEQKGLGLQQVSGMNQAAVISAAQPLINQYIQKKDREQQKKNENQQNDSKYKQNEYVKNKLDTIGLLLNIALYMKDITNEMASNGQFTRYIKQIDIDNAEGDSLTNLIQRQGVMGLANGLSDRLQRLDNRVRKYNLDKQFLQTINNLNNQCEQLKRLHSETRQIIKQNKEEQNTLQKEQQQQVFMDDIPVVDDIGNDAIEIVDNIPIVDDIGDDAIKIADDIAVVDNMGNGVIESVNDKTEIKKLAEENFMSEIESVLGALEESAHIVQYEYLQNTGRYRHEDNIVYSDPFTYKVASTLMDIRRIIMSEFNIPRETRENGFINRALPWKISKNFDMDLSISMLRNISRIKELNLKDGIKAFKEALEETDCLSKEYTHILRRIESDLEDLYKKVDDSKQFCVNERYDDGTLKYEHLRTVYAQFIDGEYYGGESGEGVKNDIADLINTLEEYINTLTYTGGVYKKM